MLKDRSMKFMPCVTLGACLIWATTASAMTEAQMEAMRQCVAIESQKPDSTRSGVSAIEFCSAVVAVGDY